MSKSSALIFILLFSVLLRLEKPVSRTGISGYMQCVQLSCVMWCYFTLPPNNAHLNARGW